MRSEKIHPTHLVSLYDVLISNNGFSTLGSSVRIDEIDHGENIARIKELIQYTDLQRIICYQVKALCDNLNFKKIVLLDLRNYLSEPDVFRQINNIIELAGKFGDEYYYNDERHRIGHLWDVDKMLDYERNAYSINSKDDREIQNKFYTYIAKSIHEYVLIKQKILELLKTLKMDTSRIDSEILLYEKFEKEISSL